MTFFSSLFFKDRIRNLSLVCLLIFFLITMQNTVFGQEASLAQTVFERYNDILTREDIQEVLPVILHTLKDPAFQSNPLVVNLGGLDAALDLVLDNPDLLLTFVPADPYIYYITLLKTDNRIREFFRDPDVRALMKDPDAVKELARLLGVIFSDVNGDGQVTVIDLAIVALFYGTHVPDGLSISADVNVDGIVNILDLTAVAQGIDAQDGTNGLSLAEAEAALLAAAELDGIAEAPRQKGHGQVSPRDIAYRNVAEALADSRPLGPSVSATLKELLQLLTELSATPETTALLPNYPNPFNPETWIPYHLSKPAEVTITIHAINGQIVRKLALGHQAAGMYQSRSRAAYWDGKNQLGEHVASGVYFYTLTAGEFTATRKLLMVK